MLSFLRRHTPTRRSSNPVTKGRTVLTVSVWGAEHMHVRRDHHIVELLREHRRSKKGDCPQCVRARVCKVVADWRGNDENVAWPDRREPCRLPCEARRLQQGYIAFPQPRPCADGIGNLTIARNEHTSRKARKKEPLTTRSPSRGRRLHLALACAPQLRVLE